MKKVYIGTVISFITAGIAFMGLIYGFVFYSDLTAGLQSVTQWVLIQGVFLFLGLTVTCFGFAVQHRESRNPKMEKRWSFATLAPMAAFAACFITLVIKFG